MIYVCVCVHAEVIKKITGDLVRNWKLCLRNEKEVVFHRRYHQRKQMLRNKTENHVRGNVLPLALACLGGFELTSFTIVHRTRTYTEIKEEVASCVGSPPNVSLSDRFSKQSPLTETHITHSSIKLHWTSCFIFLLLCLFTCAPTLCLLHWHFFRYVHLWFHPQIKWLTQLVMTQGSGPQQGGYKMIVWS